MLLANAKLNLSLVDDLLELLPSALREQLLALFIKSLLLLLLDLSPRDLVDL